MGLTLIVPGGKPRKGNVDTSYVCQEQGGRSCVSFGDRKMPSKVVVRRAVAIALICDKCGLANLLQKGKIGLKNRNKFAAKKELATKMTKKRVNHNKS